MSYDNPRPSSQPVGSVDLAVAKDDLITLDLMVTAESGTEITNRKGQKLTPLVDVVDGANSIIADELNRAPFQIVGDFADGFQIDYRSQVGQAVDGTIWRYTGALPFTVPAGTAPSSPTYEQLFDTDHDLLTNLDGIGHDGIYTRTFAGVSSMLAFSDFYEGQIISTGSTNWKYLNGDTSLLSNYIPLNELNVKDFGAKGDNSNDDTAALQAAIDYASLSDESATNPSTPLGLIVRIPFGIYKITTKLEIRNSNIVIEGDGMYSSIIQYDAVNGSLTTDDYMIDVGITPSGTNRIRGVILRDFSIRGDRPTAGATSPRGVNMLDTHHWVWERFSAYGTYQAFKTKDCWVGSMLECSFEWNYRGSELNAQTHNVRVERTVFGRTIVESSPGTTSAQLRVRACWGVNFIACDFEFANEGNMLACLLFENDCRASSVIGCYFESYDEYAIYIRDNAVGCSGGIIKSNLFNASYQGGEGKGIRFRADNDANSGWDISGNDARLSADEYLVTTSTGLFNNINAFANSIITGAGEMEPIFNKVTGPNELIKALDSSYEPFANTPTFVQNEVRIENTSTYLVTIAQEFSSNSGDQGVYLVSRVGSEINITPIVALVSGTVTAEEVSGQFYLRHTKSSGQAAALRITTINISSR